ncbi:unnamed protein product [Brassicogethes aeneus]|uniref:Checkpoint protein RAD24-like helical bundle domain-containing protein n=1 Tax=Brassicogethes aeneus TaxID=1431903 RepID=A0A9P0BIB3_BRAAE|nr:unnamed protein product [Brassicogethes aeneus]
MSMVKQICSAIYRCGTFELPLTSVKFEWISRVCFDGIMNKGWKSFDFGPKQEKQDQAPKKPHKTLVREKSCNEIESVVKKNFNFDKAVAPKKVEELAVHPKKIKEVELWLQMVVLEKKQKSNASFLLLSGPTGCGKMATLNVLCKSMNITVSEWVNPIDQDYEITRGPNQVTRFIEFLTETKYVSLFDEPNQKKIAIVKDFPNAVLRNTDEFFRVLEECYYQARCPIVFICTDGCSNNTNLTNNLFPQEIMVKYQIPHIQFNTCATTILKTCIKKAMEVIQKNPECFKVVSPETIEAILASCQGDIRSAMNQLHMASLNGCYDIPMETSNNKKGKRKRGVKSEKRVKYMIKDETLGLFHGLGRVLNPKKVEEDGVLRINCDFEKLIDEFSTQPGNFTAFLFENYTQYFGDVNDAAKAADILSVSQIFLEKWQDRHEALIFALWVSVMGLMIFNEHKVSKWTQIRGPTKVNKSANKREMRGFTPTDCYYYNIINKSDTFHVFTCN